MNLANTTGLALSLELLTLEAAELRFYNINQSESDDVQSESRIHEYKPIVIKYLMKIIQSEASLCYLNQNLLS